VTLQRQEVSFIEENILPALAARVQQGGVQSVLWRAGVVPKEMM